VLTQPTIDARRPGARRERGLRVLLVASAYPRSTSDVITPWLGTAIHRLAAAGVVVDVLAPAYRGLGDQTVDGVVVHRFRYAPRAWERLTHEQTAPDRIRSRPAYLALVPSYVCAGALAAARLTRGGRYDVVHALWPLPHGLLGLAARWAADVPLVTTFFGAELSWLGARSVMRRVLRVIVERSDAVTAISSSTAERLTRLVPGASVVTIPFGAAIDPPAQVPPAPSGAGSLLFVGRLVERKGVHVLLDALARLGNGRPTLDVVGDGPERAALVAQAARLGLDAAVRFHGTVPAQALTEYLSRCDALVLPAVVDAKGDTEGLGVVLLEALAHSRPVIASAAGGIPDIVRHDVTGLLVPAGDAGALAAAIAELRADPARARRLAEAGRRHVADAFSWDAIVPRLAAVYEGAVRSRREGRR
jgi:glycosyltransferase involved in cell wall biosynthesis